MHIEFLIKDEQAFKERLKFAKMLFKIKHELDNLKKKYRSGVKNSKREMYVSEKENVVSSCRLSIEVKKEKKRFSEQLPGKIKAEDLHEGRFLLNREARDVLNLTVQKQQKLNQRYKQIFADPDSPFGKFLYVNPNYEVFVGTSNTYLGKGSYGTVFAVQNALTGKWYCMKTLKSSASREHDDELSILAQKGMLLSSEKGRKEYIIICELIQGKNLKAVIREIFKKKLSLHQQAELCKDNAEDRESRLKEAFSFEEALALIGSEVEAFASLHRNGYVHRDIKPDNIMFDSNQQKCFAIDFGFAGKAGEEAGWKGTPKYMAPEVYHCKLPSTVSDIYAMGMVAGQILALAIDNEVLSQRKIRHDYYEKLSVDTLPLTKERYDSLKEIFRFFYPDQPAIKVFIEFYLENFAVIFGAKDPEYQKRRNLSAEAIALCRLICQMTEPLQKRPGIDAVLKKIREIRLGHIKNRMIHFMPVLGNDYNNILNKLYSRRRKLNNAIHALDDLDIFLLRAVNINEKSRPHFDEIKEYLGKLDNTRMLKTKLVFEMQRHFLPAQRLANEHRKRQPLLPLQQPEKHPSRVNCF
jgi:serine/threonine protein kinase